MRRLSPRMLGHRVDVLRAVRTGDGQGGYIDSLAPAATALRCRMTDPKLANRVDEDGQLVAEVTRTLYAEPGSDIRTGDTVINSARMWLVQSADDQPDGIYRKAFLLAEQR